MAETWATCYRAFDEHVSRIAGDGATDCGFFRISSPDSLKNQVRRCARTSWRSGQAVKFGHMSYGDDSTFCDVAIRDGDGQIWSFFYDSDVSGGSGGPATIWVSECRSLSFVAGTIGPDSFFSLDGCVERKDLKSELLSE